MNKLLSHQEKKRLHQYLMWRDGNKCLYCKKAFKSTKEPIIEHLNDDRNDNRWDNLAYAHQRCNVLKGTQDSTEYLDIGLYKLEENELHNYVKEGFLEKPKKIAVKTARIFSNSDMFQSTACMVDIIFKNMYVVGFFLAIFSVKVDLSKYRKKHRTRKNMSKSFSNFIFCAHNVRLDECFPKL